MSITMSALEDRLRSRARRERRPTSCLFEITPRCNLRCHFCYVALDPYQGPYLTTEQVDRVFDILEHAGVLWLTLTGGEILSRRDFAQIYTSARRRGFLVTLYTNATMITERTAALLREEPPFSVEVSIYGADAAHYEGTTGIPGSFARFVRGIDYLMDAGVPLTLKCPVSQDAVEHVPALVEFCGQRGLAFKFDPAIDARHDGGQQPTLYRIEARKVPELREMIYEMKHGHRREGPLPECSAVSPDAGPEELYRCGAGRTGFFIDANGNASHCVIDRSPSFPILEMPWEELWARMGEWVTQPLPPDAPCSGCGLRGHCDNCPARSRLATGSPYLKDTYYCDTTHASFGLEPVAHPDYRSAPRPLGACVS